MRVAHDGEKRIEEKRDQRRDHADGADQRDEKGEQRERRHRLDHSHGAKDRLRRARQLCRGDAEGNAHDDARRERHQHQNQVFAGQAPEIRTEERGQEFALAGSRLTGEKRGGIHEALAFELGRGVHADHLALVDAPLQLFECRECGGKAPRHLRAIEQHGVVARKKMPVVLEHAQPVALDLRVGRIDVHHLDAPGADGLVGEAVIEPRRRRLRQAVGALQSRPAVGAADELLRQAELERGMAREVGELGDAQGLRALPAHRERIGVVEAEPHARRETLWRQRGVQLLEVGIARQAHDLGGDRAGVLGIDVDGAGLQRGKHDAGIAEPGPVLAAGRARQDLAEDVGLGKALGADVDRVLRVRGAREDDEQHELHPG